MYITWKITVSQKINETIIQAKYHITYKGEEYTLTFDFCTAALIS